MDAGLQRVVLLQECRLRTEVPESGIIGQLLVSREAVHDLAGPSCCLYNTCPSKPFSSLGYCSPTQHFFMFLSSSLSCITTPLIVWAALCSLYHWH